MAFVLEDLTDEQREQQGFRTNLQRTKNTTTPYLYMWVVNSNASTFLIGGVVPPDGEFAWFELHWDASVILVSADRCLTMDNTSSKSILKYTITRLIVPAILDAKIESLKKILCDAIKVFGNGRHNYSGATKVIFANNLKLDIVPNVKSRVKE